MVRQGSTHPNIPTMTHRKKVNSRLKQLAESRARATATIERLNDSLSLLLPKIEEAKAALHHLEEIRLELEHRLTQFHNEIRATDKTIKHEFPLVQPSEILATYGFRSEYGRRGALRETIKEVIREAGDEGITLKNIGLKVTEKLALVHHTHADFRAWVTNSLESALHVLKDDRNEITKKKVPGKHPHWLMVKKELSWDNLARLEHEISD